MKLLKISLTFILLVSFSEVLSAQSTSKQKIVVVEKITDENGKVTTKKFVKEGAEAEKYMSEKKIELGLEKDVKHVEKEVSVEVRNVEVSKGKKIVIKIKNEEGEEEVLMWDGEGEMPEEMKKHMQDSEMEIDIEETLEGDMKVVVSTSDEKPRLGIIPENHVEGVEVMQVLEGSAAENAGIMKGDIIYEVGGKTIGSDIQLSAGLEKVAEGETTTILLLRKGVKKSLKVKL